MPNSLVEGLKALCSLKIVQEEGNEVFAKNNNSKKLSGGENSRFKCEKIKDAEISWGATDDKKNAARIIESIIKQKTGDMCELEEGLWITWDRWFNWNLIALVRCFKQGHFNINCNEKANRLFNIMIGSPVSTPVEKEILRRGLKVYLEFKSRYENGNIKLSRFHAVLMSGVFSEKVFIIFDADRLGYSLSEVSTMRWSFSWHDITGNHETYKVKDNWEIVKGPCECLPNHQIGNGVTTSGSESKMDIIEDNKNMQVQRGWKLEKKQPPTVPDIPLESEERGKEMASAHPTPKLIMHIGAGLTNSDNELSVWDAFMKTPWAVHSMKLSLAEGIEHVRQQGFDLRCIPSTSEEMIQCSMEQLATDLAVMAVEDLEKRKTFEKAAHFFLSESKRAAAQTGGTEGRRGASRT